MSSPSPARSAVRIVAIHQPNFFPWLGYFDKIARADVFVILDHIQFNKSRPGNWSNRVQMAVSGQAAWVTMPVVRAYEGGRRIDEMLIDNGAPWRKKLLQLLRSNYGRAAAFRETFPFVADLVENPTDRVADYNIAAVTAVCARLGLRTDHLVRSSQIPVGGRATDMLVALVRQTGGTRYLAGGGSSGYQEDGKFHAAGIDVEYQQFQHPVYEQRGAAAFLPGLSILDVLFNCGFDGTARLLARPA